jgi:hypothetical protein
MPSFWRQGLLAASIIAYAVVCIGIIGLAKQTAVIERNQPAKTVMAEKPGRNERASNALVLSLTALPAASADGTDVAKTSKAPGIDSEWLAPEKDRLMNLAGVLPFYPHRANRPQLKVAKAARGAMNIGQAPIHTAMPSERVTRPRYIGLRVNW